jgi:5-methylcytosine-specific restriction endonuclease McrA
MSGGPLLAVCPLCNGMHPDPLGVVHTHPVNKRSGWNEKAVGRLGPAQGWRCAVCRFPMLVVRGTNARAPARPTVMHLWPRMLGGPNADWNVVVVHEECNAQRGTALTPRVRDLLVERIGAPALAGLVAGLSRRRRRTVLCLGVQAGAR